MYRYWFSEPSRRPELKGNPVRIRNSARCCKSLSFGRNGSSALFATGFYREGAVNGTSQKTCRNNDWILYLRDTGANRTAGIRRPVQPISLAFPGNKSATKKSSEPDDERSETHSIHFGEGGGKSNIRFTGFSYIDDACGMFRLAAGVVRHAPKYGMPNFQMVLNPELFCPT